MARLTDEELAQKCGAVSQVFFKFVHDIDAVVLHWILLLLSSWATKAAK
ncbi:MAG: hypothetical protein HYY23_05920 [Verrucomicrobia bacterium]|nr:hypothetical protein [Verrucomicrobiota bacterium]